MADAGYWCLGILVCWAVFQVIMVAAEPIIHYGGDNTLIDSFADRLEEVLSTISAALFLSMPVAAVYGCYLIGKHLWSLVA